MSHTIFGTAHLGHARCTCPGNPDGCPLHQSVEAINAPDTRQVEQLTGTVLTAEGLREANDQLEAVAPGKTLGQHLAEDLNETSGENARLREALRLADEQNATLARQRDDAIAERDNMVDLTIQVGRLGDYLKHAIADRDEYRERADDWRDRFEDAQVRMDEMAAEIRELRGQS